ncbi:MAG: hypothetical protein CL407_02740 [Acidimicrobiaceae bacterium]|nr:hypothetical protein [Acidimicrobiaceae bacterium]
MSDEPVEEEIDEIDADPDLLDEEMGEEIEIDLEGDDLIDDDDDDENREIPAGARPASDDDDEDEEDDEVEADLDTILKERMSAADDDEDEDEDEDEGVITTAEGDRIPSKQEDEILCEGCFLLVKESQYDMRDGIASCPHCGTQLQV